MMNDIIISEVADGYPKITRNLPSLLADLARKGTITMTSNEVLTLILIVLKIFDIKEKRDKS